MLRLSTLLPLFLLLAACARGGNESKCDAICTAYRNCYDADFDDNACEDRCQPRYDRDDAYEDAVDACQACIDGISCAEVVGNCDAECSGVLDDGTNPLAWP